VWWICAQGKDHVWRASPVNRSRNPGCPFCERRKLSRDNSLAAHEPELAAQWHPTKNGKLKPSDLRANSYRVVYWQCPLRKDHVWRAAVALRVKRRTGCRQCVRAGISPESNLRRTHPRVARLWHPTKNGDLLPEHVASGTSRGVWWKCPEGPDHEWRLSVIQQRDRGCPFCLRLRASVTNSLAVTHPVESRLWHPTKNGSLTPRQVLSGSGRQVWWKCPAGPDHEWQTKVSYVHEGTMRGANKGCPFCQHRRASVTNSLASLAPRVARLWDRKKNEGLLPRDVLPGSRREVWWHCRHGPDHSWRGKVDAAVRLGGCPFCLGRRLSVTNSLRTLFPKLARQWHPTKNRRLEPEDVLPNARERVWWRCPRAHSYSMAVVERTARAQGCPVCALS
jgi:hypothetical protein